MIRLVKRYGSRKLYDTEESRYVALDEIAAWIRDGQHVQVVENKTGEDVTVQILGQIIAEQDRRGGASPPAELLHELIRAGEQVVSTGVGRIQSGAGRLLQAGVDRLGPVRRMRAETDTLRRRLEELEAALANLDTAASAESD